MYSFIFCIILGVLSVQCQIDTEITEAPFKNIDICSVCTCGAVGNEESDSVDIVLYIQCTEFDKIGADNVPSLDVIKWPPNVDKLRISASFEGLGLTNVEWLPYNSFVDTLSFSNNHIDSTWPGAFEKLPNLRRLSFSQNELTEIRADMFTKLFKLEELDLSNNQLTSFNSLDFESLKSLKKLNLNNNSLEKVPVKALEKLPYLEDLDISKNRIFHFEKGANRFNTLKRINLSGNRLTVVVRSTFGINNIEYIDLSSNDISHIDDDAFVDSTRLIELNLSDNKIRTIFQLPPTLCIASFNRNALQVWPKFPKDIRFIDLSHNELVDIYESQFVDFNNLEILILVGNQLQTFKAATPLPKLYSLDLSYNLMATIPTTINSHLLPALEELRLDGNPIQTLQVPEEISLKTLYLDHLDYVRIVKADDFKKLRGRNDSDGCLHLHVSSCNNLQDIEAGAFIEVPLCYLDLGNNNLTDIASETINWDRLRDGINLQGNPWNCDCPLQWMLDYVIPMLYKDHPNLLQDLRCDSPRSRNGLRLVHWYNWSERPLCREDDMQMLSAASIDRSSGVQVSESNKASMFQWIGDNSLTLGLSIAIFIVVSLIIVLVIYLISTRNRSYKLRQAMLRKRQTAQDTKDANAITREQFTALNRA